jgi:hypothetical protein
MLASRPPLEQDQGRVSHDRAHAPAVVRAARLVVVVVVRALGSWAEGAVGVGGSRRHCWCLGVGQTMVLDVCRMAW